MRASFIDAASGDTVPFEARLETVTNPMAEDAEALGCTAPPARARKIAAAGTDADRQRTVFAESESRATDAEAGLRAVVDWVAATTR